MRRSDRTGIAPETGGAETGGAETGGAETGGPDQEAETGSVGARIVALRRKQGWTQERLAGATGVSRSAVAQWETDRAGQGRDKLARVARVLGVTLDTLLHGDSAASEIKGDELALLRLYRECSREAQAELLRHAHDLRDKRR